MVGVTDVSDGDRKGGGDEEEEKKGGNQTHTAPLLTLLALSVAFGLCLLPGACVRPHHSLNMSGVS